MDAQGVMIPLWELGYVCANPNTSSLGIEDKLALESDADGKYCGQSSDTHP